MSFSITAVQKATLDPDQDFEVVQPTLVALLLSFLRIGAMGFGGGMAIIALMEEEIVRKLRAMTVDDFLAGVGLSQFLGAFPVNAAAFVGYRLFGITGALLSACMFLLPSVALVVVLSAFYFRLHAIPALGSLVGGVTPVVIALIVSAGWSVGRRVVRTWQELSIAAAAMAGGILLIKPVWILLLAGVLGLLINVGGTTERDPAPNPKDREPGRAALSALITLMGKVSVLGFTFLKMGLLFFGGGFVLVPLLRSEIVTELGWLTPKEFVDGIAISSLTPGPIAVIATFVGYKQGGIAGAITSTIALFLPGILLMLWIGHSYLRFRNSTTLHRLLEGINPATVGLIVSAAILLGWHSLNWKATVFSALALLMLTRLRWHPALVISLGAVFGYFKLY